MKLLTVRQLLGSLGLTASLANMPSCTSNENSAGDAAVATDTMPMNPDYRPSSSDNPAWGPPDVPDAAAKDTSPDRVSFSENPPWPGDVAPDQPDTKDAGVDGKD